MRHFFGLRSKLYDTRKEYQLKKLLKEYEVLHNKVRFIQAVIDGEVIIMRKKRAEIAQVLK